MKIALLRLTVAIAMLLLGSGPVFADDLAEGKTQHAPSLGQRLRASLFPGFPRPSDTPYITHFNARKQQRYAFAEEQERAADAQLAGSGTVNSWTTTQPVGNVFKFDF